MSASENDNPIEKAEEIIERFGGIRPMAKKMDIAVTTVQGWKKRGVIPAARREAILAAALANDVDLSGMLTAAPVAESVEPVFSGSGNDVSMESSAVSEAKDDVVKFEEPAETEDDEDEGEDLEGAAGEAQSGTLKEPEEIKPDVFVNAPFPRSLSETYEKSPAQPVRKSVSAGVWINLVLALIIVAGLAALLWPRVSARRTEEDRLKALEQQVAEVEEKQSFFGTLIPKDLDEQLESLRDRAGQAQEKLGQVVEKAQEISDDVMAEDAGTLEERAVRLGGHLQDLAHSPELAGMMQRLRTWSGQQEGQEEIDRAVAELGAIIGSMGGQIGDLGGRLHDARLQSTTLNRVFDGVPSSDLKAAALLLGVTQFRSSLDRDNQPFANDLEVVKGLIGQDDPELMAALDRLAPSAEQGVLTPAGLGSEFKSIAGEAVVASLKGEDVSITERAKARLNEVLQVEKDGELLTGTETQASLARTEKFLDSGDLESAIQEVRSLDGPAAETVAPWLDRAEATLAAQKVDAMLERIVGMEGTDLAFPDSGPRLIRNEETGINILKSH